MRLTQFVLVLMLLCASLPHVISNSHHNISNSHQDENEILSFDPLTQQSVSGRYSPGSSNIDEVENLLVLAVDFPDERLSTSLDSISNTLFGSGNSMSAYYDEVSYGNVIVSGDVFGSKRLSKSIFHYDNSNTDHGNVDEAIRETIDLFDASVDFSAYDDDGDGVVDNFMVVVAGESDSSNGDANRDGNFHDPGAFWPHRWSIPSKMTNDGVVVSDYFLCTEECGMGTYAHELAHNFGLPDLYDYDGSSVGIGEWGLMGAGNHLKNGWGSPNPAHLNAWSKMELGLLEPTVVDPSIDSSYSIDAASLSPEALKVEITADEYFLIEYRSTGADSYYDSALPGSGVLIWHIDESICIDENRVNNDEDHPCVRLIQADGDKDLDNARNRGDSGDAFVEGDLFNSNSYPPAVGYDGDDPGIQLTVTAVYSDYAVIHFGSFTAWFYDIEAYTADANGDGFNNEIVFTYDPDTDGASQDIKVHFDFYTEDRASFVKSFEYDYTIMGADFDEFEASIGYYNGQANGMWWVEARLEIGESITDEHVFGNIWIEYPSINNHYDDYLRDVEFYPTDFDDDGGAEILEIYVDWDSYGTPTQADFQVILTNPDYPSEKSIHSFSNKELGYHYLSIDLRETSLRPGMIDATVELYVDGDREHMISERSLALDWESIVFTYAFAEGLDVDGDGEYDSVEVTWQIDHSFRQNTGFDFEVNAWAWNEETNWFDPFPSMQQAYNRLLGPGSEGFTGGRDFTQTLLQSDAEAVVSIEIRAVHHEDGREFTHWVDLGNGSTMHGIEVQPVDWAISTKDTELASRDESGDGNDDTAVIYFDVDTNAAHMQVGVEILITAPDSSSYTLWENFTISGDEVNSEFIEFITWMDGLHHVQAKFWDLDEGDLELSMDLGTVSLSSAFEQPHVSFELPDEGWVGMPCLVGVNITDMASQEMDATTSVEWGYAPLDVADDVLVLDCSAWTANNHILSVTYKSSIGLRVVESVNFEMKNPPNLEVWFDDEILISNKGEPCGFEPMTTGVDSRTNSSWAITNDAGRVGFSAENHTGITKVDCSGLGAGEYTISYTVTHPSGVTDTTRTGLYVVANGEVTREIAGSANLKPVGIILAVAFSFASILGGFLTGQSLVGRSNDADGDGAYWEDAAGVDSMFDESGDKPIVDLPGFVSEPLSPPPRTKQVMNDASTIASKEAPSSTHSRPPTVDVDENGTQWWEDDDGVWWYKAAGDSDWHAWDR